MKFGKKHLISVVAVVGALVIGGASYEVSAASAQAQGKVTITVKEVKAAVQETYPDYTIGEIELENDTGTPVYDVEATNKDGVPYDIEVDPNDGTILKVQIDEDYSATE